MEHAIADFLGRFGIPAMVFLLTLGGLGVPISEDLVLLCGGALAGTGVTPFWPTLVAGYLGVLFGDLCIRYWGARLGPLAWASPRVQKRLSPARQEKLRHHFERHGFWTLVIARHTPVLRAPAFFLAGASGVSWLKFLVADALSCAVTVPLVVWLGSRFAGHLPELRERMHGIEWMVGAAAAVVGMLWLLVRHRMRARRGVPG